MFVWIIKEHSVTKKSLVGVPNVTKDFEIYCKGVELVTETFSSSDPDTGKSYQKDVTISLY